MNQDVQKFIDLLKTDESLQEKMKAAAENYEGEKIPEDIFMNLVLPMAEEAGCHFTWDDYQEYLQAETKNLNLDEMAQVAGGGSTIGTSLSACYKVGIGAGLSVKMNDDGTDYNTAAACFLVGFGESSACAYAGASTNVDQEVNHVWND